MIYLVLKSNSKVDITNTDSSIIHKEIFNPCKSCYELNTLIVSVKNNNTHEVIFTKLKDVKCIEVLDEILHFDNGFRVDTSNWIYTRSDKLRKAFEIQRKYDLTRSKKGSTNETIEQNKVDEKNKNESNDIPVKNEGSSIAKEIKENNEEELTDETIKVKFIDSANDQEIFIQKDISLVEFFEKLYENGVYKSLVKRDNFKFVSWTDEETDKVIDTHSNEKLTKDLVFKANWKPLNKKH